MRYGSSQRQKLCRLITALSKTNKVSFQEFDDKAVSKTPPTLISEHNFFVAQHDEEKEFRDVLEKRKDRIHNRIKDKVRSTMGTDTYTSQQLQPQRSSPQKESTPTSKAIGTFSCLSGKARSQIFSQRKRSAERESDSKHNTARGPLRMEQYVQKKSLNIRSRAVRSTAIPGKLFREISRESSPASRIVPTKETSNPENHMLEPWQYQEDLEFEEPQLTIRKRLVRR